MEIIDSNFVYTNWIGAAENPTSLEFTGIDYIRMINHRLKIDKVFVNKSKYGTNIILPKGTKINLSSSTADAHYVVCGKNIASNYVTDYLVGSVSGSVNNALSRTVNSNFNNALSVNSKGNLVFTQINTSSTTNIYPKCYFYVDKPSVVRMQVKLKDTGSVSGSKFKLYLCIIGQDGLITYKDPLVEGTVSSEGTLISGTHTVPAGHKFLPYIYSSSPQANAQTTFEDYVINIHPTDTAETLIYTPYNGTSNVGDGTLYSQ